MDIRPVAHVIGWLVAAFGAVMTLPTLVDLSEADGNGASFAVSGILTALLGGLAVIATRTGRRPRLDLRQSLLVTAGAWLALPAAGSLPFLLGVPHLSLTDAIFEATSAMTTTGGTVIAGLDHMPDGILLWRGILQWVGGIGVVLMAILILPVLGIGGTQIARTADFNTVEKILPHARDIALAFGQVYFILTFLCALGYLWSGMSPFDALVHSMTTIATGGMANHDASFGEFTAPAQYVSMLFMLLSAMSFVRFVQALRGDLRPLLADTQIRTFLAVFAAFTFAVVASRALEGEPVGEEVLRGSAFTVASILSTTGFATEDYILWGPLAVTLVFCAGMICGCSGSTSGGPKVFRYQLLATEVNHAVTLLGSPHRVMRRRYQGRPVSDRTLDSTMAFFLFFFLTLGLGAALLVLLGLDPLTAISGAATSISNIGPGLGPLIGPAGNFVSISAPAKWVMIALMVAGRLELLTIYAIFTLGFWRR